MKTPGFKIILCLICAAFFFLTIGAEEKNEEPIPPEAVKAVYILKFTNFIDWPDHSTVSDKSTPFVIGVLGDTPSLPYLIEQTKNTRVKNKKVKIKMIKYPDLAGIKDCHILFITEFTRRRFKKIMEEVGNLPVLTVGDTEDYARKGVMINMFISEEQYVRFNVNLITAKKSGINIYSKISRMAEKIYKK